MKGVNIHTHRTLSIRISTNGFCFCSYNATEPDSLLYHSYVTDSNKTLAANFNEAWSSCPFATEEKYKEVSVIIATNEFTTLPAEFDNKDEHKVIYNSCFPNSAKTRKVVSNRLTAQGITVLFSIDLELHNRLCEIGDINYFTSASILMGFITRKQFKEENFAIVYCSEKDSIILSFVNGKFHNANSYTSDNPQDHIFYILSIWNETGLSQTEDTIYLCGDRTVEEITPMLSQFISHHNRINPTELFRPHLLNKIKEIPFDLQTLLLCE